ncbi:filamentous hemagglutinin N-terminal domain-containing protein [Scytonema tolypothrichoides VB-61278]|nr:filamentous hemagglutinin N-terminal domain-containing protein [Scytonema tolypothrichoides VB-61278]
MEKIWSFLFTLPLSTIATLAPMTITVAQQVTPDGTVSTTVITPDGKNFNINDGTIRGTNLFHSFKEFSVPTGGSATFNNAANIQNIISRVTGGSVSSIDGLIRTLGKANLFLLNPAGIIFGPNAQLNIGGSFLGSTANSFLFDNGFEFSATDPQAPPLLTINVPIGLRYRDNPQNITSQSANLEVPSGKFLTLVGGNVSLNGGTLTSPGGRVELGGLSTAGTVGLSSDSSLSFPLDIQRADISLTNNASINVSDKGAGSVTLTGRNINMLGGNISAGIGKTLTADNSPRGDITLNAIGKVTINYPSRVTNIVDEGARGNAGDINIKAGEISVTNIASTQTTSPLPAALATGPGGQESGQRRGQGRAGNISLEATGSISLIGQDQMSGDRVISTYNGVGQSGNISLKAGNSISLDNAALISSSFYGSGGNISLQGNESVSLINNSFLVSQAFNQGLGGEITLESSGPVFLQHALINSAVGRSGMPTNAQLGNAGDIKISGRSVFVTAGTEVSSRSFNSGNSGQIVINAIDKVEISGTQPPLAQNRDRSRSFSNSILTTTSERNAVGNAGNITINARNLLISDQGQVSLSSRGTGNAGSLTVTANSIKLDNRGKITGDTTSGEGNITLNSFDLILRRNSSITTNATDKADGGNITINSPLIVAFPNENSDITANAFSGSGGKITIRTQGLFGIQPRSQLTPESDITAFSQQNPSLNGTINIITPDVDPTRGLFELSETVIDPAQQIAQNVCTKGFGSSFTITGRGGFPPDPNKILSSDNIRVDLVKPSTTTNPITVTVDQPSKSPTVKRIIPAQGWIYNEKGEVLLVGYDPTKTGPQRQQQTPASSCAAVR